MAGRKRIDPKLTFWNFAAVLVFGAAVGWGVYVWTHPDYVPPCHETTGVRGGGQSCHFSKLYRARRHL